MQFDVHALVFGLRLVRLYDGVLAEPNVALTCIVLFLASCFPRNRGTY